MAKRPLSAAQLQHNRDIAKKGGEATARKYGGYHFAHQARSAKAHGTYVVPPKRAPFAALRAKTAATRGRTTKPHTGPGALNLSLVKKTSSLAPQIGVGRSALTRSIASRSTRRRPAVR